MSKYKKTMVRGYGESCPSRCLIVNEENVKRDGEGDVELFIELWRLEMLYF